MVVTSAYEERIVGVPDPEDDCLVVWGLIKANEPPRQLIDGGEYFVLKTVAPPMWSGIPEGTCPVSVSCFAPVCLPSVCLSLHHWHVIAQWTWVCQPPVLMLGM